MVFQLDFDKINKFIDKNGKYTFRRRSGTYILPFPTREPERAKFDRGFSPITSGVIRQVYGKNVIIDMSTEMIEEILSIGKFKDEESKTLFTNYLKDEIKELSKGKITSLQQLKRVPLTENENERKGEIDLIRFFFDTFIRHDVDRVREILQNNEDNDLVSEILDYSQVDTGTPVQTIEDYHCFFPNLREQFLKDLENMAKNPSFLVDHLPMFFIHYTFVAITQLILQTNKITGFNGIELLPVFYLLQWEKAAKWRDSYRQGYKMLLGELDGFFAHEHALNIVGMNTFLPQRNQFYHDIQHHLRDSGPEAEREFVQSIYKWLTEVYKAKTNITVAEYSNEKTLDMAYADLIAAIKTGLSDEVNSRYRKAFEAIVSKFFRKHGGSLGTILSFSQEQLLLLIAVSITEDRIELKQLWRELEMRGVWFDHHSKEEVVKVLDKLNYLEKKSDSGDAQYVKSIL